MKKKIGIWILTVLLLAGIFLPAVISSAANTIGYTGPLDPETGEPISEDDGKSSGNISLDNRSWYNMDEMRFVYQIGSDQISVNVADGMVLTDTVYIGYSDNPMIRVYKDGEEMSDLPNELSDPGSYVITSKDNSEYVENLSFQIVGRTTGALTNYIIPDGFYLTEVLRDGVDVTMGYGSVDLKEEGYYEITYMCSKTNMYYDLDIVVDHTPPQVEFVGVNKKNKAKGPVTIKGLEEGDTVYVTRNNKETHLNYQNKLKVTGRYYVKITDRAGNTVTRSFEILVYLNMKAWMFIGIIILIIAGVVVALVISRKRLRVR